MANTINVVIQLFLEAFKAYRGKYSLILLELFSWPGASFLMEEKSLYKYFWCRYNYNNMCSTYSLENL